MTILFLLNMDLEMRFSMINLLLPKEKNREPIYLEQKLSEDNFSKFVQTIIKIRQFPGTACL